MKIDCKSTTAYSKRSSRLLRSASLISTAVALATLAGGCWPAATTGPDRLVSVKEEVSGLRSYFQDNRRVWRDYLANKPDARAAFRNELITARMYAADMEYTEYELKLMRDGQMMDFGTKIASGTLTTLSGLMASLSTSHALAQSATFVNGIDTAYNDKILRTQLIQNIQAAMRTARHEQAAVILANMRCTADVYTLGMALSDLEAYYRAGTFHTGVIKLSQTVGKAEATAKAEREVNKPNPSAAAQATLQANMTDANVKAKLAVASAVQQAPVVVRMPNMPQTQITDSKECKVVLYRNGGVPPPIDMTDQN